MVCCNITPVTQKALWLQAFEHAQDLYRDVHHSLLDFNNRIAKITTEVQQLLPDVLSLQEVDRPDDFVYSLSKLVWVAGARVKGFNITGGL